MKTKYILKIFKIQDIISLFCVFALFILSLPVFSQGLIVKGIVAELDGTPMIGVEILEKNTTVCNNYSK